jgi:hypothetical protein
VIAAVRARFRRSNRPVIRIVATRAMGATVPEPAEVNALPTTIKATSGPAMTGRKRCSSADNSHEITLVGLIGPRSAVTSWFHAVPAWDTRTGATNTAMRPGAVSPPESALPVVSGLFWWGGAMAASAEECVGGVVNRGLVDGWVVARGVVVGGVVVGGMVVGGVVVGGVYDVGVVGGDVVDEGPVVAVVDD